MDLNSSKARPLLHLPNVKPWPSPQKTTSSFPCLSECRAVWNPPQHDFNLSSDMSLGSNLLLCDDLLLSLLQCLLAGIAENLDGGEPVSLYFIDFIL